MKNILKNVAIIVIAIFDLWIMIALNAALINSYYPVEWYIWGGVMSIDVTTIWAGLTIVRRILRSRKIHKELDFLGMQGEHLQPIKGA